MKVAELTGALLDHWVAKAWVEGLEFRGNKAVIWDDKQTCWVSFEPSSLWTHGGPIIEREKIAAWPVGDEGWNCYPHGKPGAHAKGSTVLLAAMRAYVTSKFGEEVPDDQ